MLPNALLHLGIKSIRKITTLELMQHLMKVRLQRILGIVHSDNTKRINLKMHVWIFYFGIIKILLRL